MINPPKKTRLESTLYRHIGRFEVLVGVAMLAAASALFALSRKGSPAEGGNPALTMLKSGVCVVLAEGE